MSLGLTSAQLLTWFIFAGWLLCWAGRLVIKALDGPEHKEWLMCSFVCVPCFPFNYLSSLLTWQHMSQFFKLLFIFRSALKIHNQIELCKVMARNLIRFSRNGLCKLLDRENAEKKLVQLKISTWYTQQFPDMSFKPLLNLLERIV